MKEHQFAVRAKLEAVQEMDHDDMNDNQHIEWLLSTLCPDLLASGHEGTVDDFMTLIDIAERRMQLIRNLEQKMERDENISKGVVDAIGSVVKSLVTENLELKRQVESLEHDLAELGKLDG